MNYKEMELPERPLSLDESTSNRGVHVTPLSLDETTNRGVHVIHNNKMAKQNHLELRV